MITVQNGATLITEGNLTLNGNNHRNNGAAAEGGSSAVDCINASWYGSDTTICNNWNYGYIWAAAPGLISYRKMARASRQSASLTTVGHITVMVQHFLQGIRMAGEQR
jgi:hypothetical protein